MTPYQVISFFIFNSGKSIQEIAKAADIPFHTLYDWAYYPDRRPILDKNILNFCDYFAISLKTIVTGIGMTLDEMAFAKEKFKVDENVNDCNPDQTSMFILEHQKPL